LLLDINIASTNQLMLNIYLILIKKEKNLSREREREIINNRYIIYCKFVIFYLILLDTHYREDARAIRFRIIN